MDLELRHFRALEAVGRKKSFTDAARSLGITQPALSRTIQQLEARLGATLLDRSSRSVELTAEGHRFCAHARVILREVRAAVDAAAPSPTFTIGFTWALPDPWLARTLAAFERRTGVSAQVSRHDDARAALDSGAVDAVLTRFDPQAKGVQSAELFTEPRVAAVSSRSRLAERASITWNELANRPMVINEVSGNTRPELWAPEHRPAATVTCRNYDEWITLIAAGRGVGATPASAAASYSHAGVTFIPLEDAPPVPLYLGWSAGAPADRIEAFRRASSAAQRP